MIFSYRESSGGELNLFYRWRIGLLRTVMVIAAVLFIMKGADYLLARKAVYINYRGDSISSFMQIPAGLLLLYVAFRLRTPANLPASRGANRKESRGH